MRKLLVLLLAVFVVAVVVGAAITSTEAGPCSYRCICGTPYKCCTTNGVTTCKVATGAPILCPQIACI
ncbi:MAG TPA: hypothetical protein VJS92_06720 [Candidatus Polarisedimenticolaceae bacterium]|nr:hypothetical protein [Candidatus Polarisedimenticolaceae bacterium]